MPMLRDIARTTVGPAPVNSPFTPSSFTILRRRDIMFVNQPAPARVADHAVGPAPVNSPFTPSSFTILRRRGVMSVNQPAAVRVENQVVGPRLGTGPSRRPPSRFCKQKRAAGVDRLACGLRADLSSHSPTADRLHIGPRMQRKHMTHASCIGLARMRLCFR